jgi:hypothetical protein
LLALVDSILDAGVFFSNIGKLDHLFEAISDKTMVVEGFYSCFQRVDLGLDLFHNVLYQELVIAILLADLKAM